MLGLYQFAQKNQVLSADDIETYALVRVVVPHNVLRYVAPELKSWCREAMPLQLAGGHGQKGQKDVCSPARTYPPA